MKKTILYASFFFFLLLMASFFIYLNIYQNTQSKEDKELLKKEYHIAIDHMKNKRFKDAFILIKKNNYLINSDKEEQKKWFSLLVDASSELNEVKQLAQIFEFDPYLFSYHEKASLQLASYYLLTGKEEQFLTLRQNWKGREAKEWEWLNNDVEFLVLNGNRDEALRLIHTKNFHGKDEEQRLFLLSMLYAHEHPQKSLEYLTKILELNPKNLSALNFRANVYEKMNYENEAFEDYLMALLANPYQNEARNKLANYYFNKLNYSQGIDLYESAIDQINITDDLFVKLLFWNKIFKPLNFEWETIPIPSTQLKGFLKYLMYLKDGQFWDNLTFNNLANQKELLSRQESYWLQLLSSLSSGNELDAEKLLNDPKFQEQIWNKNLFVVLKEILNFRKHGNLSYLNLDSEVFSKEGTNKAVRFVKGLRELSKSDLKEKNSFLEEYQLLLGPLAFPLAFLALEWNEAALQLNASPSIPDNYPPWVTIAYAEAIEKNRGPNQALQFLEKQKSNHLIEVAKLRIKMTYNLENEEKLLSKLTPYALLPGEVGFEASKLMALIHLSNDHFIEAEEVVLNNKILKRHPEGGEIIAKVALAEGNFQKANMIYLATENLSLEAQSFLARRAFSEKNWLKAKELTLNLLKVQPNNPVLQNNYFKILENIQFDKHK